MFMRELLVCSRLVHLTLHKRTQILLRPLLDLQRRTVGSLNLHGILDIMPQKSACSVSRARKHQTHFPKLKKLPTAA